MLNQNLRNGKKLEEALQKQAVCWKGTSEKIMKWKKSRKVVNSWIILIEAEVHEEEEEVDMHN